MKVRCNQDAQIRNKLQHDWDHMAETITLIDLNDTHQVVVGDIPIVDFTTEDEEEVKSTLEKLCSELDTALSTR